ncbi:unnamed protein product [Rotaria socialis]
MTVNNTEHGVVFGQVSKSIVSDLNLDTERFIMNLPGLFFILGLIGFIGNSFTYLQAAFRSNSCCIYSLCGSITDIMNLSINLFSIYLRFKYQIYIPWHISRATCKLNVFLLAFIPHLSISFLLMAIIDRFACTCKFASRILKINELKMVP